MGRLRLDIKPSPQVLDNVLIRDLKPEGQAGSCRESCVVTGKPKHSYSRMCFPHRLNQESSARDGRYSWRASQVSRAYSQLKPSTPR